MALSNNMDAATSAGTDTSLSRSDRGVPAASTIWEIQILL